MLSVDVSDWDSIGILHKKPAKRCNRDEIVDEVKAQIRAHLKKTRSPGALDDDKIIDSYVDEDIKDPNPLEAERVNAEPLLINRKDSWKNRPQAYTKIENLFLASDYVRTYTDVATMEGANETARRAVNAILKSSHSTEPICDTWPLHYPGWLYTWLRYRDQGRLLRKKPQPFAAAANLIAELERRSPRAG